MSRHNSVTHLPPVNTTFNIPKSELSHRNQEKTLLPLIKSENPLDASAKTGVETWSWFEHHPIEKNEKVPSIGHFRHTNTNVDDKNISFIRGLFEYNREVETNTQSVLKNQEDNYTLSFKPKTAAESIRTRKHEIEYPMTLTYRVCLFSFSFCF